MKALESFFEALLWNSRYLLLIVVLFSLVLGLGVLIVTSADTVALLGHMVNYLSPEIAEDVRESMRLETLSRVVGIVDGYLVGAIMMIFALGIYELFVSKIEHAEGSEFASRLLLIRSLDDLKDRLANMILLIIIVKFFQQALNIKYASPAELMYLAVGVALVAGALYLSARAKSNKSADDKAPTNETP
jgi:uncharacterized membrane protein YqhA